jgi:hypothetical protein
MAGSPYLPVEQVMTCGMRSLCWVLVMCLCLPITIGCGPQRGDQKQINRGLDRPKHVKDAADNEPRAK